MRSERVGVIQRDAARRNHKCAVHAVPCAVTAACVWASSDASLDKENAKVGLFIAASIGTFALMAGVYCIYTKFYTKQQYLHTQLSDDSGKCVDSCNTVNGLWPALSAGTVR